MISSFKFKLKVKYRKHSFNIYIYIGRHVLHFKKIYSKPFVKIIEKIDCRSGKKKIMAMNNDWHNSCTILKPKYKILKKNY